MRVISQDGAIDVPYEISSFSMAVWKYNGVEHVAIYCHNSSTAEETKMAEYHTEEKAKKAMGLLRNEYVKHKSVFCFPSDKKLEAIWKLYQP